MHMSDWYDTNWMVAMHYLFKPIAKEGSVGKVVSDNGKEKQRKLRIGRQKVTMTPGFPFP